MLSTALESLQPATGRRIGVVVIAIAGGGALSTRVVDQGVHQRSEQEQNERDRCHCNGRPVEIIKHQKATAG